MSEDQTRFERRENQKIARKIIKKFQLGRSCRQIAHQLKLPDIDKGEKAIREFLHNAGLI